MENYKKNLKATKDGMDITARDLNEARSLADRYEAETGLTLRSTGEVRGFIPGATFSFSVSRSLSGAPKNVVEETRKERSAVQERTEATVAFLRRVSNFDFQPFSDKDWYGYSGCESPLPYIAYPDKGTQIIIDGDTILFDGPDNSETFQITSLGIGPICDDGEEFEEPVKLPPSHEAPEGLKLSGELKEIPMTGGSPEPEEEESEEEPDDFPGKLRCDQCASARVNGVFIHEAGCPNQNKIYDPSEGRWMIAPDPEDMEESEDEEIFEEEEPETREPVRNLAGNSDLIRYAKVLTDVSPDFRPLTEEEKARYGKIVQSEVLAESSRIADSSSFTVLTDPRHETILFFAKGTEDLLYTIQGEEA